jgi:hypothetical protein
MSEVPLYCRAHGASSLVERPQASNSAWRQGLQGYLAHENCTPLRTYSRTIPRVLGGSYGGGSFLMSEVPLEGLEL